MQPAISNPINSFVYKLVMPINLILKSRIIDCTNCTHSSLLELIYIYIYHVVSISTVMLPGRRGGIFGDLNSFIPSFISYPIYLYLLFFSSSFFFLTITTHQYIYIYITNQHGYILGYTQYD